MQKKRLFIIIDSLVAAGAEKSLTTFLSVLDYTKFEVDLQLFGYGGEFERYLPREVRLLPPFAYTEFARKNLWRQLATLDFKKISARIRYSLALRNNGKLIQADRARYYWKYISPCLPQAPGHYDAAIAYAQGLPTFYVAEKVQAPVKFAWVNVDYHLKGINKDFQERFYSEMTHIVAVSDSSLNVFKTVYPRLAARMVVIWDMMDARLIEKMAAEPMEKPLDMSVPRLMTVARLNKPQKGYDIALEACRILRDRGVAFKWYAVGRGPYEPAMREFIAKHHLEDCFILLGATPNPYPYIKNCTVYVQTSRHEGYGLSIAEARMLNRPVVTTAFAGCDMQMVPGKNGLVTDLNPTDVAGAVQQLLTDKSLYNRIEAYQRHEKKGNTEEIEKFYRLLNQ